MTEAIILAGGLGTRLRDTVPNLPKPMAPVNGKPFLEYLMSYLIDQGISSFHLSIGYKSEIIKSYFQNSFKGVSIIYYEEEKPLGTGGCLMPILRSISKNINNIFLVNGDTFFEVSFSEIKKKHVQNDVDLTISLFEFNEPHRYGEIIRDINDNVVKIDVKSNSQKGYANGGVYFMNVEKIFKILNLMNKETFSFEQDIIPKLISSRNKILGLHFKKPFLDIGLPDDFLRAGDFFNNLQD